METPMKNNRIISPAELTVYVLSLVLGIGIPVFSAM